MSVSPQFRTIKVCTFAALQINVNENIIKLAYFMLSAT